MADEEKGGEPEGGAAATDEADVVDLDWDYRLLSLERVLAAPEEDESGEDFFIVKFQVDGPSANAEIDIVVSDFTDEANVISIAQHTLHVAMTMWGRITSDRLIRARAGDLPKRGAPRRRG